jgi:hypothetical protein
MKLAFRRLVVGVGHVDLHAMTQGRPAPVSNVKPQGQWTSKRIDPPETTKEAILDSSASNNEFSRESAP